MRLRRSRCAVLAFIAAVFCLLSRGWAAERVPVVAVTPFKPYFDMGKSWDEQIMAVRDRVVAELVRDYACVVLNRSYGYSVALEDAVRRLSAISEENGKPDSPYGADYSVTGMFQAGVTNIECVLRLADLRERDGGVSAPRVITVEVPAIDACAPLVARAVAQAVGIAPRAGAEGRDGAVAAPCTWAVLPSAVSSAAMGRLKTRDGVSPDAEALLHSELALQRDARVRLVDRSAFERVLDERARSGLTDAPAAEQAARLAGADRLLLGRISAEKGGGVRIDLLGVDAETAEVLAAATGVSDGASSLGAAVEEAVGSVLAGLRGPGRLVPAQAGQRVREARLYLESAHAASMTYAMSGNLAVIEFAEMAYLVARDNPQVVGEIVRTLSLCTRYEYGSSAKLKKRIAEVADRIVKPFPEIAVSPPVLLARAQAHAAGEDFEAAYRLIRQFAEAYPNRLDAEARRVLGECHLKLGRPREALAALAGNDNHFLSLQLRLRAYRALGDEEQEFALMDTMTHRQLGELLERYLELLAKRKGAAAAVGYIELSLKRDSWLSARPDIRLFLARYSLAAGDRAEAAALCQQLWDEGQKNGWSSLYVSDSRAFKERVEALRREAGASEETWLKARELQAFPASCALYLQPLGQLDTNLLEHTRASVQDFFGARTVVLPALALTKDDPSYHQDNNKYDAARLLPDTLKRLRVPSDALAVVLVTRETIFADGYAWTYSRRVGCGLLCSYSVWQNKSRGHRETSLRNSVIGNISNTLLKRRGRFPCITAGTGDAGSSAKQKFAYCAGVQAEYRALDLEAEQRRVIGRFREAGAKIVPPPPGQ